MMLGTKSRYAVMAMVELALRQGEDGTAKETVSLSRIAERQEIPLAYLEQIFARLKKAKLVQSVRGPGGGYRLALTTENITILAILRAVEEPVKMTRCGQTGHGCMATKARCLTHDLWEGLGNQIDGYLQSVTLADICARNLRSHPLFDGSLPATPDAETWPSSFAAPLPAASASTEVRP